MKTYGLLVADNGSDLYVSGTYDNRWDNGVLNPAFSAIKASDFEVIQLGWQGGAAPTPSPSPTATATPTARATPTPTPSGQAPTPSPTSGRPHRPGTRTVPPRPAIFAF
jgi:hypothetical protein